MYMTEGPTRGEGVYDLPFPSLASLSHGRTSFSWSGCVRERKALFTGKLFHSSLGDDHLIREGGGGLALFGNIYSKKANNLTSTFLEWGGAFSQFFSFATVKFSNNFPARFARIKFLNNVVLLSYFKYIHIQCINEYIPL